MEELIESANASMDKVLNKDNGIAWAFFYLAMAATQALINLASSAAKIAARLEAWDRQGTLDVTINERDKY